MFCIKYFNWIQGLKAASKVGSSGLFGVGPEIVDVFAVIKMPPVQFIKGYFNVSLASLNPDVLGFM